jgi:hypothetical protein
MTTFAALLKERYYDSSIVEKLTYPENPLLGMLEKKGDTGMVGVRLPVPFFTRNGQGVGGVFSTAQTNASATASDEFNIEAGSYFGVVQINDKAIMAARNNAGAFLEHKRIEIDSLYETMGEMESLHAWGNGGGALAQLATLSTNDFTLVNPETAANLEPGMAVKASAADGSVVTDALRAGTSTTISKINRATGAGTLTLASNITSLAAGDYLFRESDFAGDQSIVVMKGLQAFITATDAPAALWGISAATRASDPQRYAGCRVDPTQVIGMQMDEKIKTLLAQMTGRFKAKTPTAGFLHPEDFLRLEQLMTGTGLRSLPDDSTKFGYRKIDIQTPTSNGTIPIYIDRHCPKGTFFALRMDNWWISSMGELMHPMAGDGNEILRVYNSTDYEFRLLSYPLVACNAPKNSGRVSLI